MRKDFKSIFTFLIISLSIHAIGLFFNAFKTQTRQASKKIKIRSIRVVGENDGIGKSAYLKPKPSAKKKKKIKTKQLAPDFSNILPYKVAQNKKDSPYSLKKKKKSIKALSLSNKNITGFLKGSANEKSAKSYLDTFDKTDSLVKLEVPKGIKETELNKHELVFYSFQKRTAQTYINSFHKKLTEFKTKNPHLNFPLTDNKEQMMGRVIYDKDGNIVKIKMMKWTRTQKLQDFFLDVLKEMNSLPNPPKAILKDDQFTVFFSLTVNA